VGTVHEFSNGPLNPALAYAVACLGAFLGFRCITRARAQTGFARANWLILAAVAIGAAGNWAMHFIAMLGVTIPGQQMLYNVPLTILSMLIVIVVVGIGLFVGYGTGNGGRARLVTGGVIAGLGVACMHYLGEAAMVMPDSVHYNTILVVLSVLIAVSAGIAGLWAGIQVRGIGATIVASLIMGVAITGIHYLAMAAMEMTPGLMPSTSGSAGGSFLFPLVLGISLVTFILALTLSLSPTEDEIAADALLKSRIQAGSGGLWTAASSPAVPQPVVPPQATAAADNAASAWDRPALPHRRGPSRGGAPWA
jgi:NO-binding membrane sensor protein with MHYT domain